MFRNHSLELFSKCLRISNRACFDHKAFKLIVIMLMTISMMDFMMRFTVSNIVFRTDAEAEQHVRTKLAEACWHHVDTTG